MIQISMPDEVPQALIDAFFRSSAQGAITTIPSFYSADSLQYLVEQCADLCASMRGASIGDAADEIRRWKIELFA